MQQNRHDLPLQELHQDTRLWMSLPGKTEKIMAVTAQINHFHSAARADDKGTGFFARLMTRISLISEARAIHRLETEAAHLLDSDQLRQIKTDFAARKAQALK
jgi:hypothetical protein